jgi:hypothetical protein
MKISIDYPLRTYSREQFRQSTCGRKVAEQVGQLTGSAHFAPINETKSCYKFLQVVIATSRSDSYLNRRGKSGRRVDTTNPVAQCNETKYRMIM